MGDIGRRYLHDDGYYYEVQPLGPARRIGHPGYGMAPAENSLAYPQEKRLFDKRKAEWEAGQYLKAAEAGVGGCDCDCDFDSATSALGVSGQLSAVPPGLGMDVSPPPPPPPPDNDDAKVARREEEIARQLRIDIIYAGEGGWRSQYYTGLPSKLASSDQAHAYRLWQEARDTWTRTGDEQYLTALRDAVDFTCPPDALVIQEAQDWATEVAAAVGRPWYHFSSKQKTLLTMLAVYVIVVTAILLIL
jgi:hypothetical protein